jgi:hypothetical protein
MNPLMIGILAFAVSLVIVPLIAKDLIENTSNAQETRQWLEHSGRQVRATVTQLQTGQDWKYEQGWDRDPWEGSLKQKKTWQMYYDVTAHWMDPRTKQVYTFHGKVWSDELTNKPVEGHPVRVIVDDHNPIRHKMDLSQAENEPQTTHEESKDRAKPEKENTYGSEHILKV